MSRLAVGALCLVAAYRWARGPSRGSWGAAVLSVLGVSLILLGVA